MTEEEVLEAAEMASAMEFVNKLEHKLDTNVGERGSHLSGGQKQRVAIARCGVCIFRGVQRACSMSVPDCMCVFVVLPERSFVVRSSCCSMRQQARWTPAGVCVCMRVCVCACMCACVRVCVCA